jgi:hypothetical protein
MSRPVATVITFLISALAHELVMGCITKKLRGYGFFAMMLQMPIVMFQRSRWVKGRTLLNVRSLSQISPFYADLLECSILVFNDIGISYGKNQPPNLYPANHHLDMRSLCSSIDGSNCSDVMYEVEVLHQIRIFQRGI